MSDAMSVGNSVPKRKELRGAEIEVAMIIIVKVRRPVGNGMKSGQAGKDRPLPRIANVGMRLATLIVR